MKAEADQSTLGRGKQGKRWGMMAFRLVILGGFLLAALAGGMEAKACSLAFCTGHLFGSEVHLNGRTMDWGALMGIPLEYTLNIFPRGLQHNGSKYNPQDVPIANPATWTSKYGSLTIDISGAGVNEMGLSVDMLYLDGSVYATPDQTTPCVSYLKVPMYLLDNAATVSESLDLLSKVLVVEERINGNLAGMHFAIRDASNDMAIIEFVNAGPGSLRSQMVVYHGKNYDVMTNEPTLNKQLKYFKQFSNGKKGLGGDFNALDRFVRVKMFKKTLPDGATPWENVSNVFLLMDTAHTVPGSHDYSRKEHGDLWPNVWTSVVDVDNLTFYLKLAYYPNTIWVDLKNIDFVHLNEIGTLDPKDFELFGEVSGQFIWSAP
jgi:choloylglycine hydrolase